MSQIKTERSPRKVENSRQRDQNIKCGTSAEAEEIMKHREWTKRAPRSNNTKTGWAGIREHICRKKVTVRRYAQQGWGTIGNVQVEDRDEEQGREKEQDEKAKGLETRDQKIRSINNTSTGSSYLCCSSSFSRHVSKGRAQTGCKGPKTDKQKATPVVAREHKSQGDPGGRRVTGAPTTQTWSKK